MGSRLAVGEGDPVGTSSPCGASRRTACRASPAARLRILRRGRPHLPPQILQARTRSAFSKSGDVSIARTRLTELSAPVFGARRRAREARVQLVVKREDCYDVRSVA